jgi:hypothetical protein
VAWKRSFEDGATQTTLKKNLGEEEVHIAEEVPSATAETTEKPFSLEEFEAALEKEPMPKPEEKMMQPFMPEPPKREAPKKEVLPEIPPFDLPAFEIPTKEEARTASVEALWSEEMKGVKEEPLKEVLSSKSLLEEEDLTMEALEQALGPLVQAEAKKAVMPKAPAKELIIEEEPLAELVEEEFPQEFSAEAELTQENLLEEELREEEFPKALLGEKRREGPLLWRNQSRKIEGRKGDGGSGCQRLSRRRRSDGRNALTEGDCARGVSSSQASD